MSDDLIRRSDAIKAFCMDCKGQSEPCEHSGTCKTLKVLRNRKKIPTAEPKQGEWIYCEDEAGHDGFKCDQCGKFYPWYYEYYHSSDDFISDYERCPMCGAVMAEGYDGEMA